MSEQTIRESWDYLLQGDPNALGSRAAQLQQTAEAILAAAHALQNISDDSRSDAVDALRSKATDVAGSLKSAHRRYAGTATAVQTFAVDLEPIQRSARAHIDQLVSDSASAETAQSALDDAVNDVRTQEYGGGASEAVDRANRDLRDAQHRVQNAAQNMQAAISALQTDDRDREEAADRAVQAIENVIGDGKDSWLDNVHQKVDDVVKALAVIAQWVKDVVGPIVDALLQALESLASQLIFALEVLLVVAVLGLVLSLLGPLAPFVVALAGLAIAAVLVKDLLQEWLGTPKHLPASDSGHTNRFQQRGTDAAHGYGDLIRQVVQQDKTGTAKDATDIRVVAITNAAGKVVAWRVQLPSTQYWSPLNSGGVNDLSTDIALSMFPGVPGEYEKAVLDAMRRAGVNDSSAPIMFTGWSLGGMMAGKMATNPEYADRVTSVVTAGSAIDKYRSDLGEQVRVTQFDNTVDPVHHLEFFGLDPRDAPLSPNWQTHWFTDDRVHDGTMYGQGADKTAPAVRSGDQVFFADETAGTYEQVYTDRYTR